MNCETIGNRAYNEIRKRARKNGVSPYQEAEKIGILYSAFYDWGKNGNPSAYYLQQMALAGYDVIYILTGKENKNVTD